MGTTYSNLLAHIVFSTNAFWMNLQARYDLETAADAAGREIERSVKPWRSAS
jgi:plasmid maintenance system antidote protein VapI